MSPAAGATLGAGVQLENVALLGISARWLTPRTLPDIAGSRVAGSVDLALLGAWSPSWRVAPWLGGTVALSTRAYEQGGRDIDAFVVPVVGLDAGAVARLGPRLAAGLLAHGARDTATTRVTVGDSAPLSLPPWALSADLTLTATIP